MNTRLLIVGHLYFQRPEDQPLSYDLRFSHYLTSVTTEPYHRSLIATTEPKPLDLGWIKQPSFFLIRNTDQGVLILQPGGWRIYPKQNFFGRPEDFQQLTLAAQDQPTRYELTVFPS